MRQCFGTLGYNHADTWAMHRRVLCPVADRRLGTPDEEAPGFHVLPWDSSLFGFPVAHVSADVIHTGRLPRVVESLRAEEVRLGYISVPWSDATAAAAIALVGGRCVDRKVRFRKAVIAGLPKPAGVESVLGKPCTADLESLALVSGTYSRFRADPRIPPDLFERLYVAWIHRSMSGEIAEDVLVVRVEDRVSGMVTVVGAHGDAIGVIGLIAVGAGHRGRGYGRRLMLAAEAWCAAHDVPAIEVATQRRNAAACCLYDACGYEVVRDEAVFHIWLEP